MEGNLAATYALVYRFLRQQSQNKAAEAVKKAAKAIIVLRDDIEQDGPPLQDIIKEWKAKEDTKSEDAPGPSSEDSDSSDDSTSDPEDSSSNNLNSEDASDSGSEVDDTSDSDDSSDDSDDSVETTTAKKLPQKAAERDTSATLSSVGENALAAKQVARKPKKSIDDTAPKGEQKSSESDSDGSDSDSAPQNFASDGSDAKSSSGSSGSSSGPDSSDEDEVNAGKKGLSNRVNATEDKSPSTSESSSDSSDEDEVNADKKGLSNTVKATEDRNPGASESSSDSSDEGEMNVDNKAFSNRVKATKDKSPSTSESSTDSEDHSSSESQLAEEVHVAKKRKICENGAAVTTAAATGSQRTAKVPQREEKLSTKVKERFQRVKVQNIAPEQLLNNGYEARGGETNDYGERAHRDLMATRGMGFRKEKNKKKRGSYRGGEITMENHSIKFDF